MSKSSALLLHTCLDWGKKKKKWRLERQIIFFAAKLFNNNNDEVTGTCAKDIILSIQHTIVCRFQPKKQCLKWEIFNQFFVHVIESCLFHFYDYLVTLHVKYRIRTDNLDETRNSAHMFLFLHHYVAVFPSFLFLSIGLRHYF